MGLRRRLKFCGAFVAVAACLLPLRPARKWTPPDPAELDLAMVHQHVSGHYSIWSHMCRDEGARSCAPTKALERQVVERLAIEGGTAGGPALAQDLLGYVRMIMELRKRYPTLGAAWRAAPKTAEGEIAGWASIGLGQGEAPESAFAMADSDQSGGLSEYEVIDFMHLGLEIAGAARGLLGPYDFDPWAYGDWAGLNGKEREEAIATTWRPPE